LWLKNTDEAAKAAPTAQDERNGLSPPVFLLFFRTLPTIV
jgi:hypothetical protein